MCALEQKPKIDGGVCVCVGGGGGSNCVCLVPLCVSIKM